MEQINIGAFRKSLLFLFSTRVVPNSVIVLFVYAALSIRKPTGNVKQKL